MLNSPLELLARQYGNEVKYDADGNPSIFCRFPKVKSSDLDSRLPNHVHPAFVVNNTEDDAILIGKFKCAELSKDGTLYSLSNMPPRVALGQDAFLSRMRAFGDGVSGMTIADHGFLLLLAAKNGWAPKGNNYWSVDYRDGSPWEPAKDYTVGTKHVFRGWEYECLIAHTSSAELLPINSPIHWKPTGKHLGGTPAEPSQYCAKNHYQGYNTLNGSGPLSWYLDGTPGSLCDIQGNCFEQVYGFRLVRCELQILGDNNNAADPSADCSANGAWKAILPHKSDSGYDLVAPSTLGTVHYTWANNKVMLDTVEPTFDNECRGCEFKDMGVNMSNLPHIPTILYELGLAPLPGSTTPGYSYIQFTADERVARRGGYYYSARFAGMSSLYCYSPRPYAGDSCGGRPRSRPTP